MEGADGRYRIVRSQEQFAELLDRVERGEEVVISRRGKSIAKLVPLDDGFDRQRARQAAQRIHALATEMKLGPFDWDEWKRYRDHDYRVHSCGR